MSTATQRPTPETDDIFDAYARCACGTACIRAKMQQIERERDEALAALSGRTVSCSQCNEAARQLEAMREAIREARAFLSRMRPSLLNIEHDDYVARYGVSQEYATSEEAINGALAKLQPFLK